MGMFPLSTLADLGKRERLKATRINPDADYTIAEITAVMEMGRTTFYRMRIDGKGPTIRKRGRRSFVRGSDFLTWRDTVQ